MNTNTMSRLYLAVIVSFIFTATVSASPPVVTDGPDEVAVDPLIRAPMDAELMAHDAATAGMVISDGPSATVIKNISLAGRGERLSANATTDVWAHGNYAYTGTFNSPCGGDPEAGIWIWDVHNKSRPAFTGVIPSPVGSRSNDVKVASMGSGDILVHSNESCAGGPGGFEIWNVDDPANPVHLAHVQTDDVNALLRDGLGFTDFGVHNLWLFSRDGNDYVAAMVASEFGNFQIFDITDPTSPTLMGFWGAESNSMGDFPAPWPNEDYATLDDFSKILDTDAYLFGGFGASQNRFLQDATLSADGTRAYLANWDAGLVLLDISDVTNPMQISVALDVTSEDGEVNSNAVWLNEDGSIVVEGEEDLSPFGSIFTIDTGPNAAAYPSTEGSMTVPILPGAAMTGPTIYVGFACPPGNPGFDDPVPAAGGPGKIALIQRAGCDFSEKIDNAETAGYDGAVVFNDAARGDALVLMAGDPVNLPGVFVGHSTGLAIVGVATDGDLVIGAPGAEVTAATVPNSWGGVRIWDYSDPANPVLASTFNTICSANPADPVCDPADIYSAHNVVVETIVEGKGKKKTTREMAYISWYSDGVLVLDITDPNNPVEVARYAPGSPEFVAQNGGAQDVWGIYKIQEEPWIYASDRNGGLYVLKEYGSGSAMKGKK